MYKELIEYKAERPAGIAMITGMRNDNNNKNTIFAHFLVCFTKKKKKKSDGLPSVVSVQVQVEKVGFGLQHGW